MKGTLYPNLSYKAAPTAWPTPCPEKYPICIKPFMKSKLSGNTIFIISREVTFCGNAKNPNSTLANVDHIMNTCVSSVKSARPDIMSDKVVRPNVAATIHLGVYLTVRATQSGLQKKLATYPKIIEPSTKPNTIPGIPLFSNETARKPYLMAAAVLAKCAPSKRTIRMLVCLTVETTVPEKRVF